MAQATSDFAVLATLDPARAAYLVRLARFADEVFYSRFLIELGDGNYLMILEPGEIEGAVYLPFQKARLRGGPFPRGTQEFAPKAARLMAV